MHLVTHVLSEHLFLQFAITLNIMFYVSIYQTVLLFCAISKNNTFAIFELFLHWLEGTPLKMINFLAASKKNVSFTIFQADNYGSSSGGGRNTWRVQLGR